MKGTDFVHSELMAKAKTIKRMAIPTYEEYKKIKEDFVCPECKSKNLDID